MRKPTRGGRGKAGRAGRGQVAQRFAALQRGDWGYLVNQWEKEYDLGGGEHFEDTGGLDVGPEGPTQQIAPEDLEPEENMEGILLGFGYFPAEVTLPNNLAVRAGLVEVETTPGAFNCMQMICNN